MRLGKDHSAGPRETEGHGEAGAAEKHRESNPETGPAFPQQWGARQVNLSSLLRTYLSNECNQTKVSSVL